MATTSSEELCFSCNVTKADSSLKGDLPLCLACYQQHCSILQVFKDERLSKGKTYPEIDEIIKDKLYLGNEDASLDKDLLKKKGITHILVAGDHMQQKFPKEFIYKIIEIQDSLKEQILPHLEDTFEFIDQGKTVFVHCAAGVSRSASIVIAYIMKKQQISFQQAFDLVKSLRKVICPNGNFKNQLKKYEETVLSSAEIADKNNKEIDSKTANSIN